jgi:hypothetical protein
VFNSFYFENHAVCEIMWKNMVEPDRPQMTIWRMRIAWWLPEATDIHSEYVILIALPRQCMFHERASMLLYCVLPFLFLVFAIINLLAPEFYI